MQYYYQKGLYLALTKGKPEDVFFDFAQILDDLDERHQSIFSYLSYIGLGKLYQNLKRDTQAKFFFGKVEDYIDVHKDETFQKSGVNVYLRILTLVFYTAEFLIKQHEFKKSRDLIKRGIKLCSEQHITYYLPRLKLLAAEIAIYEEESYETIDNLLSEALAFAKINQNEKVELRVNALREKYNRENQ